jgi:hypothetical protein
MQKDDGHTTGDRDFLTREVDFHVSFAVDSAGFDQVRSHLQ